MSTIGEKPLEGEWGPAMDVILCLLPIAFLVATTVIHKIHLSTSISLPLAAFFMWIVRMAYLDLIPAFTNAAVVYGALDALTPLSIIAGAIILFETMEVTKVRE
jgi:lactate permease